MKIKISCYYRIFLYALLAFILILGSSNSFGYEWSKTFGGSNFDYGGSVQQTTDGGFIIAGTTNSFGAGGSDIYLIKTDAYGDEIWSKTFGGSNSDYGGSVQQTNDGGFIVAGTTDSFGAGRDDVYLIKTDSNGNEIWSKTFGGTQTDTGRSIQQTTDGSFIIAGRTYSFGAGGEDVYLIKTDSNGNEIWSKTFGWSNSNYGSSVQLTADGGFIIVGSTTSYHAGGWDWDVYLIKTDDKGNERWSKILGGGGGDYGSSVQQTADGGFIIAGGTNSFGSGSADVYLIKTDAGGNEIWSKTYGGSNNDSGGSVQQTTDGGFIVAGRTESFGAGDYDLYLIKTDADGNEIWIESKTFGGSNEDYSGSVQQTTDGGFIIAGTTNSFGAGDGDVYLVYFDPESENCDGKEPTILGTEGHDFIKGTTGPDVIHGLGGHDVIEGLGGDDVICGGEGADHITGHAGNDYLSGGKGHDVLIGGSGDDEMWGNWGNDTLMGGSGYDVLWGGTGPSGGTQNNNDTCYDALSSFIRGCEVFYER